MAAFGTDAIREDPNFRLIASSKTDSEELLRLVDAHIPGYTQRKRLLDGLKDTVSAWEAIEQKMVVAKAVGKLKGKLDPAEESLYNLHKIDNLKEKVQSLNASIQASLDAGQVTAEEQPTVIQHLDSRLAKAKLDGKEKLKEKLERQLAAVKSATPKPVPLPDIKELHQLTKALQEAQTLAEKPRKALSEEERKKVRDMPEVEAAIKAARYKSRMWFESEEEFKPRYEEALVIIAKEEEEQARLDALKREEEKRLATIEKEQQRWNEMNQKLEQKRLAEKDLPQKPAQQSKKKKEKKVIRLDNKDLFVDRLHEEEEAPEDAEEEETQEETEAPCAEATEDCQGAPNSQNTEAARDVAEVSQEAATKAPEVPEPAKPTKKKAAKAVVDKPSAWSAAPAASAALPEEGEAGQENGTTEATDPSPALGPSLTDAVKAAPVKKTPPPQPKKKEKKKFSKLGLDDLGFQYSDAGVQPTPAPAQPSKWGEAA